MEMPDPGIGPAVIGTQRQRLQIMHDDEISVEIHGRGILKRHFLLDLLLEIGEVDLRALKRIIGLSGHAKEIGAALDQSPVGGDAGAARQQSARRQGLNSRADPSDALMGMKPSAADTRKSSKCPSALGLSILFRSS